MDMDPEPSGVLAADRLSRLGDAVLGHILSFLPAAEAARAAALSRRWRHVFAAVHTLSFMEKPPKRHDPYDDDDGYCDSGSSSNPDDDYDEDYYASGSDRRHPPRAAARPFADAVSAALLARHGAASAPAPLRGLRIEFGGGKSAATTTGVDGWIHYAARQAAAPGSDLHVDLRLGRGPICARGYGLGPRSPPPPRQRYPFAPTPACDKPSSRYAPPGSLLRCAALRSLHLGFCRLDTTSAAALPSLHTLHLTRVAGGRDAAVQRLVSACPRLADLTLEACGDVPELSVLSSLRRLALRCCHGLAAVAAADSSELRSFVYSGPMPGPSFQTAHRPRRISSCTLDFCGDEAADPADLARLVEFIVPFAGAASLQIKSARLGASVGHGVLSSSLEFHALRHLELTGMLPEDDAATVAGLAKMLEGTPILETSLFFMPDPEVSKYSCYNEDGHNLRYDPYAALAVPEGAGIACLRETTKEINLVYYQGGAAQRMLAKFLLCNARVVDEIYCEFPPGPLLIQTKLREEITGWVLNKPANMIFY